MDESRLVESTYLMRPKILMYHATKTIHDTNDSIAGAAYWRSFLFFTAVLLLSISAIPSRAVAQGGGLGGGLGGFEPNTSYPPNEYYVALEIYRSGDLENAVNAFDAALRRTRKDINGRWIDAIPVYAMLAECYWQFGDLEQARFNIDEAFMIAVRYQGWLENIDWQGTLRQGAVSPPSAWLWPDARGINRIPTSNRVKFRSGQLLTEQAIQATNGQAFEELNIKVMDIIEVMRGLAIASYRRRILLGPLAQQEPLGSQLVEATRFPASLQLPFGKSLIASMRTV